MNISPPRADYFSLAFGSGSLAARADGGARLEIPVLAGETRETLFGALRAAGVREGFELFASDDWLVGVRVEPMAKDPGAQTETIYRDLLALAKAEGREPVRIWNYVAGINAATGEGLETYRVFCRGRSQAFERAGWRGPLPAASAVGGAPGRLAVVFAAARERPVARENPEQVPAYEYPEEHGPRSPSFSRAMQVCADGRRWTFVSGTAAIKGHATIAAGDLAGQIVCTLDNLKLISRASGLGGELGADGSVSAEREEERHFKVYLRNADDVAAARTALEGVLLQAGDRVTWLQSDICRAALLIEIEATVID